MLKRHKDAVINTIRHHDFVIADFEDHAYEDFIVIRHKSTNLAFRFKVDDDQRFSLSAKTYNHRHDFKLLKSAFEEFEKALQVFSDWLDNSVKVAIEEESMSDPFLAFRASADKSMISAFADDDTSLLNEEEQREIRQRLDQFHKLIIQNYTMDEGIKRRIASEVEYVKEAAKRTNKRDYKAIILKFIYDIGVNILSNLAATQLEGVGKTLPARFLSLFSSVFGIAPSGLN
jgi:hypothetical protein